MPKIGIMADCSSGLDYAPFPHHVKIARMAIHFDNETLIDGVDIKADAFYERLRESDVIPSTSAAAPGEIARRLEEFDHEGYTDVLYFPISFALSKATENITLIKDELNTNIRLHIYNPRTTTLLTGYMASEAQKMADKGYCLEAIIEHSEKLRKNQVAYFVVDDLKYLVRSGRLSGVAGIVGGLAKIKPILTISDDGRIIPYAKVRTHQRAIEEMIRLMQRDFAGAKKVAYFILHTGRLDDALKMEKDVVETAANRYSSFVSTITPTIGAHIGNGILGIGGYILDDIEEI